MQSELFDRILRSYLEMPVHFEWTGGPVDLVRGAFDDVRVEFGGIATSWLSLESVTLRAAKTRFVPGFPMEMRVARPEIEIAIGQRDVDRWVERSRLPFALSLGEHSLVAQTRVAGYEVGSFEAGLRVNNGWFVLDPQRAGMLGVEARLPSFLRGYLPLPRLTKEARIVRVEHTPGRITLTLGIEDFEERLSPGLAGRLRARVVPFAS